MAGKVGNPNIQNQGKRFVKGDKRINKNGRPRKWISEMKDSGYSLSEVTDAIQVLVSLEPSKLEEVRTNPNSTVLEVTIASAIINSIKRGDLSSLETLLSRVFGKPKQQMDIDAKVDITNHVIKLKFGNTDGEEDQGTQEESSEA
jgi:hypothetical protein